MAKKLIWGLPVLGVVGALLFWFLTTPPTISSAEIPQHTPDIDNGKYMFIAGGCASCHAAEKATGDERYLLGGGLKLHTPFGTFSVPNISPDKEDGIGNWSNQDFLNAMMRGVSPSGEHYYPAFPYLSYKNMKVADLLDMKAFIDSLKPVKSNVSKHDLPFPFSVRRGLGLWKLLFFDERPFEPDPTSSARIQRGAYLVRGAGHCGECHTPRNLIGGPKEDQYLGGGPNPEGEGFIANITPHPTGIASWSVEDLVYSFETGFTPEFDSFGGSMAKVQTNLSMLTAEDRLAIAEYLKAIAPVEFVK